MTRLINKAGWIVAGVLAIAVVASITGVVFGGPLNPPGPPTVPTGKTQINSLPYTISAQGSYVVNADLVCTSCTSSQSGITIAVSDVTLDLQGFRIAGVPGSADGIIVSGTRTNIEIRNGLVVNWNLNGVDTRSATNVRIDDLRVYGSNAAGGNVEGAAITIGGSSTVTHSSVFGNRCTGIEVYPGTGSVVSDSEVSGTTDLTPFPECFGSGGGIGILLYGADATITGNTVAGNSGEGILVCSGCIGGSAGANDIRDNNVSGNTGGLGGTGICICGGSGNRVDGNHVANNGGAAAIAVTSNNNRIDSNVMDGGGTEAHAIQVSGSYNTITRNSACGNTAAGFYYPGANNTSGPTQVGPTASLAANPWANILCA